MVTWYEEKLFECDFYKTVKPLSLSRSICMDMDLHMVGICRLESVMYTNTNNTK